MYNLQIQNYVIMTNKQTNEQELGMIIASNIHYTSNAND